MDPITAMAVATSAFSAIKKGFAAAKDALRDAPAGSAISSASTIAELKAAWDTSILGDSPYA